MRSEAGAVARVGAAVVVLCAAACGAPAERGDARFGDATAVSAPTAVGTAPMFAVSPSGEQAAAWVSAPEGGTDGRLYVSINGGAPVEIRDSLGPVQAHGEAPPKLEYAPDGTLYAAYTVGKVVPGLRFPLSALRLVRFTTSGGWSAPVTVTDGPVFGAHSFHALHLTSDGTIYVAWLGSPENVSGSPATAHVHGAHGAAGAAGAGAATDGHESSAAWITRSTDGGRTWSPRVRVDRGEACPCCRTALASDTSGTLYMAWRHVFPGSIRDIVVARSTDRGATWSDPVRVYGDDWRFDACPHAGPALAVDSGGTLHVAWWTGKEGKAGVFYSQSRDGARTFGAPVPLGVAEFSRPAHVQLALASPERVLVAWDDGTRQVPQVALRISEDGGRSFGERTALSAANRAARFPVLGVYGDSLVVAWSEESAAEAERARASRPDMKTPGATMGLEPVGSARVLARRGVLQ